MTMASRTDEEDDFAPSISAIKTALLTPLHAALSRPARRAYVSSILFATALLILLLTAATATLILHATYLPTRSFSLPIYLDFSPTAAHHPTGVTRLGAALVAAQQYDVHVLLHLPRTPTNRAAGNFMLDLRLSAAEGGDAAAHAHARRPACLTYYSPLVEGLRRATRAPWYVVGWRREAEVVRVEMLAGVEFARGGGGQAMVARLELSSDARLQVYEAEVVFTARFRGLRRFMDGWRVGSFVVLTGVFWIAEVVSALVGWWVLAWFVAARGGRGESVGDKGRVKRDAASSVEDSVVKSEIKEEDNDDKALTEPLSDTERAFPTYSRQPPLRYKAPQVKAELEPFPSFTGILQAGVEADDEDEDAHFVVAEPAPWPSLHSDSGLGTSMDSGANKSGVGARRRRSGGGRDDD